MKLNSYAIILLSTFVFLLFHRPVNAEKPNDLSIKQAIIFFESGNSAAAEQAFLDVLAKDQNNIISLHYLAQLNVRLQRLQQAEAYIQQALQLEPDNAELRNISGKIYAEIAQNASVFTALGYARECLAAFSNAVDLEPNNIQYRLNLMNFHLNAPSIAGGDKDIAVEQAMKIQQMDAKQGYIALLQSFSSMQDQPKLQFHIANIPSHLQKESDVLFAVGLVEQNNLQYQQAVNSFQLAVQFANDQEDMQSTKYGALYQLGRTGVLSEQDIELAINSLNIYIAEAPVLDSLPSREWAEFRLANLLELQGKRADAKSIYQVIANITPDLELRKQIELKL